ncbi:MAG: MarR family transcriptional regulator [Halioglobus sp.]|nr:MarR family transcriptional regulator [Halioglobus sp.]
MTTMEQRARKPWYQYRNTLPPNLLDLAHYLQTRMMATLQNECGHDRLRLGFAPYITLIGDRDYRPTELAEALGISRQACNQALRQVESAGYIGYIPDPQDGRAKLLTLTDEGRRLRRNGIDVVAGLDNEFMALLSESEIQAAGIALGTLTNALSLGPVTQGSADTGYRGMGGLLPRMGEHILQRLMALTKARGHPGLKLSFGQVIPHIGAGGGRIQAIAALHDVSKQAISAIAKELEELGYISREPDPDDARQLVLRFTARGEQLMLDATSSLDELETELASIVGDATYGRLSATLARLHSALALGSAGTVAAHDVNIELLAEQLQQQLGTTHSRALGRLLAGND